MFAFKNKLDDRRIAFYAARTIGGVRQASSRDKSRFLVRFPGQLSCSLMLGALIFARLHWELSHFRGIAAWVQLLFQNGAGCHQGRLRHRGGIRGMIAAFSLQHGVQVYPAEFEVSRRYGPVREVDVLYFSQIEDSGSNLDPFLRTSPFKLLTINRYFSEAPILYPGRPAGIEKPIAEIKIRTCLNISGSLVYAPSFCKHCDLRASLIRRYKAVSLFLLATWSKLRQHDVDMQGYRFNPCRAHQPVVLSHYLN